MAVTRDWSRLGSSTRARYARAGITKTQYESGASLTAARGHAATPEHPERALQPQNQSRYKDYTARRNALEKRVQLKKADLFAGSASYSQARSDHNAKVGPSREKPPKMSYMIRFLAEDFDYYDDIDWSDDDWDFMFYH